MICPRCLKIDPPEVHTCTPTDFVRELERQLAECQRERDELVDWVCHNGGLLNEWAKDWNPAKHPPLTNFIRDRLITTLAKLGADKGVK